jgi:O-antigen ligase/tetratricopeptide (TPR) repeat protein
LGGLIVTTPKGMRLKLIKQIKLSDIFLPLPFFLIPFLGGNHLSLFYITIDKFWIETTFVLLLLIAILFQLMGKGSHSGESRRPDIFNNNFVSFFLFFLPFLAVNAFSLIYTWNTFSTLNELNILVWILGAVYLFSISEKKEIIFKALLIGAVLSVMCMIIQSCVLLPNLLESSLTGRDALALNQSIVPFSSFINELPLGGFFMMLLPIALYFTLPYRNIPFLIVSIFISFGLLFSMSRIAIIIAITYIAIIAFFIIKDRLNFSKKINLNALHAKKRVFILFGVIMLSCVLLVFLLYGTGGGAKNISANRMQERIIDRITNFPKHISTLNYRTNLWKAGIDAFAAKPFLGYGSGTYENAFRKFYDGGLYSQYAHSSILKIVVETGIIGLLAFLFYLYGVIQGIRRVLGKNDIFIYLVISVVSSFIFSVFNISFEVPSYLVSFFILSSVFFIDGNNKIKNSNKLITYIVFGLIIVMLVSSFFFTSRVGLADKSIQNGKAGEENDFLFEAYNSYHDAIRTMPYRNDGYTRAAATLVKFYIIETDYHKKTKLKNHLYSYVKELKNKKDKDSELMFSLGFIYSVLGDIDAAGQYFEMARSYYPASVYYAYEAAKFYYINKQIEKAEIAIRSIDIFMPQYLNLGHILHGLYIYKIKDLESLIEYQKGKPENALKIAAKNLEDAENGTFSIVKAREYTTNEQLIGHLKNRVRLYESAVHEKQNIRN